MASEPDPNTGDRVRLAPRVFVPRDRISLRQSGASGPGGQNVNRRSTKAELRVALADIPIDARAKDRLRALAGSRLTTDDVLVLTCDEHRSAVRNRDEVIERLSEFVRRALVRPKPRRKTRPTRGSVERRIQEKKRRGEIKRKRKPPPQG